MRISPLEIQQHQFKVRFRGYDAQDVDLFLDMVAQEMEELTEENNSLREDNKRLLEQLRGHREQERTIKDALLTLQHTTEQMKTLGQREAELALSEARQEAERIVKEADEIRARIINEAEQLRRQRSELVASLRATLISHLKLLEEVTEEKTREEGAE